MSHAEQTEQQEEGIEIPLDRVNPDLLHTMIEEFVTREWCELTDSGYTLERKIEQVHT